MAGLELATAYVNLTVSAKDVAPQTRKAFSGMERDADISGKRAGKKFSGGMGAAMKGLGGVFAGVLAGVGVGNFLGDALGEARESQKVGALTANVIKTTGGAAKITAKQVGDLASSISKKTGIDDEAIQSGSNLLLTFKNVKNEVGTGSKVFDRATQAAVDLSKSGFGSVEGTSKMLGKALNDPLKGLTALGKAGVTFTAGQKKQIEGMVKAGDVLGAQKIILAEVESQVGGAAAATATAGDKARVVFDNLKESAGEKLLPIVDKLATKFTTLVEEFQNGTGKGGELKDTFNNIKDAVTGAYDFTKKYSDVIVPLAAGILAIVAAVKIWSAITKAYTAIQIALNIAMSLNPIGIIILAIVGLVAAIVVLYKKNEAFRTLVQKVWAAIKSAVAGVVDWFVKTAWPWLRDTFDKIKAGFVAVKDALGTAWDAIKGAAQGAIRFVVDKFLGMVETIIVGAAKAFGWVPGLGDKLKTAAKEFKTFRDDVNTALGGIKDKKVSVGVSFVAGSRVVIGTNRTTGGTTKDDFATGGVLPGYTPGRDVHQFYSPSAGYLNLSGGEAIMRPEFTRLVGGKAGVDALNAQARAGSVPFQGFADGGVFARVPSGKGIREGVDSATLDVVSKSAKMLQSAAQSLGAVGTGGPGMGWRAMVAWAKANIPGVAVTSTVRRGNPASDHYTGRAIDLAGGPGMSRIFDRISAAYPTSRVRSLYYSPKGGNQIRFNRRSDTPGHIKSTHYDHVHWAMKNGGVIPGRENGGPVLAGRPYVVGEKRPELFVPDTNGTILPSVGGSGSRVIQLVLPNGRVLTELVMDDMGEVISGGRTVLVS